MAKSEILGLHDVVDDVLLGLRQLSGTANAQCSSRMRSAVEIKKAENYVSSVCSWLGDVVA